MKSIRNCLKSKARKRNSIVSSFRSKPVGPDAEIKSGPKFAQKSKHSSIYMKMNVFKTAQKVSIYLGYLWKKICHQKSPNLVTLARNIFIVG